MRFFLLLFISCLCALVSPLGAQDYVTKKTAKGKAKKAFDKGMEYNIKDQNEAAIKEFRKALKYEPRFINAHLQIGACYYAMKDFAAAEANFEKVLDIDPLYNKKVFYTLGLSEMRQDKYLEAADHFDGYLNTKSKNKVLRAKAQRYRDQANFIAKATQNPVPFDPKSLGDKVNTPDWEYLPSLTADENTLIYTRRQAQEDFYISQKVDGQWQEGRPIATINTPLNEGAQSISADGKLMVFTACDRKDGLGQCDLYFSEVRNNRWTKPRNIGNTINTKGSEKQPSISANGQTLYFSSNRAGGQGGYDIWVCQRQADGSWSSPRNLGPNINTKNHESTPFIHADGQTLYFMSDGHIGMGKFDLFFARKQSDGVWDKPKNLGYPINTKANDAAMIISLDGQTAYFASDRDYQQKSQNDRPTTDLYSFELYEEARPQPVTYVQAKVIDAQSRNPLMAQVEFVDLSNGKIHTASTTDESGEFLVCLPAGTDYALNVAKENYLFQSENFALSKNNSLSEPYRLTIGLQTVPTTAEAGAEPLAQNKPVILKNVFFDTGSAELSPSSYFELDKLKALLEDNSQLQIQINGHTDDVGSDVDNLKLSEDRAKAVFDYLVAKGISEDRLRYKGYGESRPIDSNDTATGRQENRRTEFEVISKAAD
ncbi:MAG: OmpA family protein [Bacteroidota bacterium]